ncbi:hypothetical protein HZH68_007191 [Vespula germanica]|uniref:Uncharacterized protein n=1 Tax=Vespula germanica TaxID=30212 RepID=A0A834KCI8_VESGE|nr:hypothetical protein HZH68_007191 [Vespula germanica]
MKRLWGKSFIGSHGSGRHEHLADRTSESQSKFPTIKAWSGTKYSQRKEHTLAHFPKTLADHLEYGNISHRRLESLPSLRHVSRQINFRKHPLVVTTTSLGFSSNHVLTRLVEFAKHKSRSEEVSRLGLVFTSSAHVEEEESVGTEEIALVVDGPKDLSAFNGPKGVKSSERELCQRLCQSYVNRGPLPTAVPGCQIFRC